MTQVTGETHIDALGKKRTEDSQYVGQRYRFEHLALPLAVVSAGAAAGGISPGRCVPIRSCVHCRERLERTMLRSQDGWTEEADVDES